MRAMLQRQRRSFDEALPEPMSVRRDRIDRAIAMLVDHGESFASAIAEDFGVRSRAQSLMTDIMPAVSALKHARKHMERWARPERRGVTFPLNLLGARAEVRHGPKGVVGVMAPWNFPVGMVMVPMAGILAAGNRALVKPSEFTPATSAMLAERIGHAFSPEEIAVVTGGVDVAKAFAGLPFDHLIFTGATSVGRHVMRAAADNLVPVTLELGGKSPTIIGRSADLERAGTRIALGKLMNAGQICLAPDYLLVPREREDDVVAAVVAGARTLYPTLAGNPDYCAVVTDRHHARLSEWVADARAKGADVTTVGEVDGGGGNARQMPLTIVRRPTPDMTVMTDEIFGPVLPVVAYDSIDDAIDFVNARDRPLALYYFGTDRAEEARVLGRTVSGGVTINDVIFHNAMEDLPFGGIGPSGMGAYHGVDGFRTFSHARAVYRQTRVDVAALAGLAPPYGPRTEATLRRELKR